MKDILDATIAELTVDNTGKVWINIDGKCELRIGHVKSIIMDNHVYGEQYIDFEKESRT